MATSTLLCWYHTTIKILLEVVVADQMEFENFAIPQAVKSWADTLEEPCAVLATAPKTSVCSSSAARCKIFEACSTWVGP